MAGATLPWCRSAPQFPTMASYVPTLVGKELLSHLRLVVALDVAS